jgi:hypothetical protein
LKQLDAARHLAEAGVPLFLARHSPNNLGFALPSGWEKTVADPSVVDRWKPGMALCAVMGHAVDAIDIDPRNGGTEEALRDALGGELPTVYGVQSTPSGGKHLLIAPLGVRKAQSIVEGVDIQAGRPDGVGRGFIFLAPTVRHSKSTGKPVGYSWDREPDLDALLLGDDTGEGLRALVEAHHGRVKGKVNSEGSYDGPMYSELTPERQLEADETVATNIEHWRSLLDAAVLWPEGHRDGRGRGWEALSFQFAWALAKMAACPWMAMDELEAAMAYEDILPPALADDESCADKWFDGIVDKALGEPVDVPPWVERGDVEDDFGVVTVPVVDASNAGVASKWLDQEAGRNRLAGLFRRKEDLIYTPRVGEEGYVPPTGILDEDGPSQIRRLDQTKLARLVDIRYRVIRTLKNGSTSPMLFPEEVSRRVLSNLDALPHLKPLRMVTHTPIVRADGTILDERGYDQATGVLYLPERGLHVDAVPDEPTRQQLDNAVKLVLGMLQDFPFATDHDRANYVACLLIPLMRDLIPPPYKMLIIGAPQRGSGKSLLAQIMRQIHGGVFRSEMPREEAEFKKVITTILDGTSAPIVQFDNVSGGLKSAVLDGLLTSDTWGDRRLGGNVEVKLPNDRLWVATGNNLSLGGDMDRRVLWCTIDADMERPETRPANSFAIPNLEAWVNDSRGELLNAMLTIVRAWAVAGRPVREAETSDSFSLMTQVLQGILDHAGIPGIIGNLEAAPDLGDPEHEEWALFLQEAQQLMGDKWWTARELIEKFEQGGEFANQDALPADLADKIRHQSAGAVKSLGKLLGNHRNQLSGGRKVTSRGGANQTMRWKVVEQGHKKQDSPEALLG